MSLSVLLPLLLFVVGNIVLALVIRINNPRSWTNRLFTFLIVVLTIYLVLNSYLSQTTEHDLVVVLSRAIIALGAMINFLVFIFLHTFPQHQITLRRLYLYLWLLVTAVLFAAGFTPLIFADVTIINGAAVPIPGPLMPVFLLHTVFLVFGGIVKIFLKYRKSQGIEKRKIQFVLLSFLILFTLIIVFNFVITVFLKFGNFVPYLPIYLLIFNIIVTYSIIRHRLLDIRSVVARSIGYILLALILSVFYVGSLFTIERYIIDNISSAQETLVSTALGLIVVFTVNPLRLFLETITQRIFYRHQYNFDELLDTINNTTSNELDLEKLLHGVMSTFIKEMKLSGIVTMLSNGDVAIHRLPTDDGTFCAISQKSEKMALKRRLDSLSHQGDEDVVVFDELNESNPKKMLRNLDIALVVPLVVSKEVIGHLLIRNKLSGEAFTTQDLRIFELTGPQLAISVKNASSFEEIRRFNIKLTEEVRKATASLRQANSRLKELDKLKDDFVSIASHELRTPMAAIKSFLWMILAGKAGHAPAKMRHFVQRSYDSTERLIRLVNDMLNVSRIEAGRISLELGKTDLVQLAQEVVEELKARAQEVDVTLKVIAPEKNAIQPFAVADDEKIKEVLLNFAGNSLKFTPPKGTVEIRFAVEGDTVATSVVDTGVGISKDGLKHLFEKFALMQGSYRTNQSSAQGTGLGLYICRSIVELHGGKVWAASDGPNMGATFGFTLHRYSARALEEAKRAKKSRTTDVTIIRRNV